MLVPIIFGVISLAFIFYAVYIVKKSMIERIKKECRDD